MDVSPGEVIHMDENGACKFPANRMADILNNIDKLLEAEDKRAKALGKAKTIEDVKAVYALKG